MYALRYGKAKSNHERNLQNRRYVHFLISIILRQKLRLLFDKETANLNEAVQLFKKNQDLRRKQLKADVEELQRLEENERQELAEALFRYFSDCLSYHLYGT